MRTEKNHAERILKGCSRENLNDWFSNYWRPRPVGKRNAQQKQLTELLEAIDKQITHYTNATTKISNVAKQFKKIASASAPLGDFDIPLAQYLPLVLPWLPGKLPPSPDEVFRLPEMVILQNRVMLLKKLRTDIQRAFKRELSLTSQLQEFSLFVRTLTSNRATYREIAEYWQYKTGQSPGDVAVELARFKNRPGYREWKEIFDSYVHACPTGVPTFNQWLRQLAAQHGIELPAPQKRKKPQ